MARKSYPSDVSHNYARARNSLESHVKNRVNWVIGRPKYGIDMSNQPRDPVEWREWARSKLQELAETCTQDRDRISASTALLDSLDAELVAKGSPPGTQAPKNGNQLPTGTVTPYAQLVSKEDKRAALEAAQAELDRLRAELEAK